MSTPYQSYIDEVKRHAEAMKSAEERSRQLDKTAKENARKHEEEMAILRANLEKITREVARLNAESAQTRMDEELTARHTQFKVNDRLRYGATNRFFRVIRVNKDETVLNEIINGRRSKIPMTIFPNLYKEYTVVKEGGGRTKIISTRKRRTKRRIHRRRIKSKRSYA